MRAILVHDDGSLEWGTTDRPEIGPDQVLLRSAATAVNRADLLQRKGLYPVPPGASPILGLEVAGVITEAGSAVDGWRVGQEACALLEGGGYAELVAVDASMLLPVPKRLTAVEAAALPEVLYTAFLNVFLEPTIQPGESVLVHAAASGVGTAATQLCRAFGHRCLATTSTGKLDRVRELGADTVIDRQEEDFVDVVRRVTGGRGVDVILDPVGGAYLTRNVAALARGGRLVNIGLLGGAKAELPIGLLLTRRLRVIGSVLRSRSRAEKVEITAALLERAWPLVTSGGVSPVIHATMPIDRADEAHGMLRRNETVGKVVLTFPG